jgi:hypothetical protein
MRSSAQRARIDRVEIRMAPAASTRERREIGAFVRYCVARIEKEFGDVEGWTVTVVPDPTGGYTSHIAARRLGTLLEEKGTGRDGTLAAWYAIERIEQALRDHQAGWLT